MRTLHLIIGANTIFKKSAIELQLCTNTVVIPDMTSETPEHGADLLEQAHLAFLRGHLTGATRILEQILAVDSQNQEAQNLLAQVITRQSSEFPAATIFPNSAPTAQTGSVWTRPIPTPGQAVNNEVTNLLNSEAAKKLPAPLYFFGCVILFTLLWLFMPGRHAHVFHQETWQHKLLVGVPLATVVALFTTLLRKKR